LFEVTNELVSRIRASINLQQLEGKVLKQHGEKKYYRCKNGFSQQWLSSTQQRKIVAIIMQVFQ
jgi:hypothetical protein